MRDVVAGLGAHESWTPSVLAPADHERVGMGPGVRVTNPLTPDESELRQGLLPGMLRALSFNADRRQGDLRLFEVGHVFPPPPPGRVTRALQRTGDTVVDERELLGVALAETDDDAGSAAAAWQVLAEALRIEGVELVAPLNGTASDRTRPRAAAGSPDGSRGSSSAGQVVLPPGMHPSRSACLVLTGAGDPVAVGVVGEVDPAVLDAFGLDSARRRVGWLEVDLGRLLEAAPRRSELVTAVSRFPSSDVDLAFVVDEAVPAGAVLGTLRRAGGELLESVSLFDVYRGPGAPEGTRSLTFRLRFCALDHTLTDDEVGAVRARCIAAVEQTHGALLRT